MGYGRIVLVMSAGCALACAQIVGLEDPADAPPSSGEAGTVDSAGPGGDGGTSSSGDSATDAKSDTGGGVSCTGAIFCESFDDDPDLPAWTKSNSGGGASSLVTDPVRSAPRALHASNGGTGEAELSRMVPVANGISCEMSVRMKAWSGEAYFFDLALDPAAMGAFDYWHVNIGKKEGQGLILAYSFDGASDINGVTYFSAPAADTWIRVGIDIRLRGGSPGVVVRIDGKETATSNGIAAPPNTTYLLSIGLGTDKSSTADELVIDDVVCRSL